MITEVIKIKGHFMIPALDKLNIKKDHFMLEIPDELITKDPLSSALIDLKNKYSGNSLINGIFEGMPQNFTYTPTELTDKEMWYEEAKHNYE